MRILRWRRRRDEDLVLAELTRLDMQSAVPLAEATGIGLMRIYGVLARLEKDGRVVSGWSRVSSPRRRMYCLPKIEGRRADLVIIDDPVREMGRDS